MKAWQHGIDRATLDEYVDLFNGFEAGIAVGPYTAANRRTVAEWLHRGELVSFRRDGRVDAVLVVKTYRTRHTVNDFAGPLVTTYAGDRVVHRVVWRNDIGREWVIEELRFMATIVMLFVEHGAHRKLATELGLVQLSAKFTAAAEIVGIYAEPGPYSTTSGDAIDERGLVRLSLPVWDVERIARRVESLDFVEHYSNYNRAGTWGALALRGFGGKTEQIEKPSEMGRAWQRDHPDRCDEPVSVTPLGRELADVVDPVVDAIPGRKQRVRIMRLAAGHGRLDRHNDVGDPESGTRDGQIMRLHIPLVTNRLVEFRSWDRLGVEHSAHMATGETWYLDTRKPHTATNDGDTDRLHLVVDVHATAALRKLVP